MAFGAFEVNFALRAGRGASIMNKTMREREQRRVVKCNYILKMCT